MKKVKGYLQGAGVLALAVIFAKVLGAVYRVPLANFLGSEGMGVYQFVYPVFALLLTLSSGSVPTAVAIKVSEYIAKGEEDKAKKVLSSSIKVALLVGLLGSIVLLCMAYPMTFLQDKKVFWGYVVISPSVLIVSLVSCFRGYFNGKSNLIPSSLSQITEGMVKIGVGLSLTKILLPYGLSYAVSGALTGVTASELVTLAIMYFIYLGKEKRFVRVKLKEEKEEIKSLFRQMLPLVECGLILPLSQFIDSLVIVNLLTFGGIADGTAQYGILTGMVAPLVNLPVMVCISLGVAITPQMVKGRENLDINDILQKGDTAIKITFFLSIPFIILYLFLGERLLEIVFSGIEKERINLAVTLLRIYAVNVLSLSVFQIYSAFLQGLQRSKIPVKIMGMSMAVKLLLTVFFTPRFGIIGTAVSQAVGYFLAGVWIFVYYMHFTRLEKSLIKNISLMMLCGVIMSSLLFVTTKLQVSVASLITIVCCGLVMYIFSILLLGVFSEEEWKSMPLASLLVKLSGKLTRRKTQ